MSQADELLTMLGRIAMALEKIAEHRTGSVHDDGKPSRKDREDFAITMLLTNGPDASCIAKAIGVPRTTLLGWKRFRAAYNVAKQKGVEDRPRGFRSDCGSVDGIVDGGQADE
jgi:hypothetical protein